MRRRGVWVFVLIACGIALGWVALDRGHPVPGEWCFVAAGACALASIFMRGAWCRVTVGASLVCLGAGVVTVRVAQASPADLRWGLTPTPQLITIEGVIDTPPRRTLVQRGALAHLAAYNPTITRLRVRVVAVIDDAGNRSPGAGVLYVRVEEPMPEPPERGALRSGQRVRITGLASALRPPSNPGERDFRRRAYERGIVGSVQVARESLVERLPAHGGLSGLIGDLRAWRDDVRARALTALSGSDDKASPVQSVLAALLLGERDPVEGFEVESAFRRVGVAHVLAISGAHVSLVIGMVVVLLRMLGDHPRLHRVAVLAVLIAMASLIPTQAPILRAVLIAGVFVLADVFGRRYDRLNMLALIAAALLLMRPLDLFDAGFQLTFGVVAALIAIAPRVSDRWVPTRSARLLPRFGEMLARVVISSVVAWSVATPILAYHFGLVSPLAAITSVIVLPFVAVTLALGYLGLLLSALAPGIGAPLISLSTAACQWLVDIVMAMDQLPGMSMRVPVVGLAATAMALMLCVGWWHVLSRPLVAPVTTTRRRERLVTLGLAAGAVALAAWLGVSWAQARRLPHDVALRLDTLDVGDGSAHLVRAGKDAVLFDCGSNWYGIGQRTIPDALRALGAARVGTIIISHADMDHYSGVLDAAPQLGVRRVITTPQFLRAAEERGASVERFVFDRLRATGVQIEAVAAGDRIRIGELSFDVLHPARDDSFDRDNAGSLVLLATIPTASGPRRLMFVGDIEGEGVEVFQSRHDAASIRPDILEAPHHGSARPSSIALVGALDPGVVIQSTGPSRVDDERWSAVRAGRAWLCTASDGAVATIIHSDGRISVERTAPSSEKEPRKGVDDRDQTP